MKYMILFSLVILAVSCGNPQPETDPAINIPAEEFIPEDTSDVSGPNLMTGINLADQNVCRTNMQIAATTIAMYQAQHGELPATLEEINSGSVVCPSGGTYLYVVDGQSWKLSCPAHGSITDGTCDW